ncbi:hypothetical protein F5B20DRAFT_477812 [Whalleya microplaca]|nr:hypothetical protein F5B20DRAFT_477812 [Whalleya microplaca]
MMPPPGPAVPIMELNSKQGYQKTSTVQDTGILATKNFPSPAMPEISSSRSPALLHCLMTTAIWLYIFGILIDIGMLIVSVLAYTGAQGEDDRAVLKHTWITFSPAGHHIQRTEIALPSLGLIVHSCLITIAAIHLSRMNRYPFNQLSIDQTRLSILKYSFPWHALCLAVCIILIVFQSTYVPILGMRKLPECEKFGDELTQCGCVSATWIIAIVYSVFHLVSLLVLLNLIWLFRPW